MELVVISKPVYFDGEANLINRLFNEGLQILHLRKEYTDLSEYSRLISAIDNQYHNRIALHQFHELSGVFDICRLHFPEKMRKNPDFNPSSYTGNTLSTSIHDLDDLKNLSGFDYTFFSPVFNSLSKPGYAGAVDTHFSLPAKINRIKVMALGGIDADKIDQLNALNFDGAVLLGALWNNPEHAADVFIKIQNAC
ncbi:thiamine phosphate synthase [Pedobacter metabolipauper]|uniref:Thiamine-phosphate pyrophosphorylase n=1 Tax=Pedobacter metabolipauper TaxID=425513 RepID=A0A4R6SZ47_9SPHI|nr:thiamine phosphate synthase [Pedobacter metabolipauper]TDQ11337.1 thiamine-phosphate pyrophosphorylase [Pedobacter metabolipauper]